MQYHPTADYLLAYASVIRSSRSAAPNAGSSKETTTPPDVGELLKEFIDAVHALNMTVLVQIPIQDRDQSWSEKEVMSTNDRGNSFFQTVYQY